MRSVITILIGVFLVADPCIPGDWYVKNYYENGNLKVEGWLLKSKKTAFWKTYYESGQVQSEGNYFDNKKDGWWKYFHENGMILLEGKYENGKKTGWWRAFDQNKNLISLGKYVQGQKDYYWKKFDKKNRLISKQFWQFGKLVSEVELIYVTADAGRYTFILNNEMDRAGNFKLDAPTKSFLFYDKHGNHIHTDKIE